MSKSKITGKVLAVQFGRRETQIVLVNGSEILHGVSVPTPAGAMEDGMIRNPEAVRDLLKTALKEEPRFKRVRQVVFSICTSQVITESVTVPALPNAKLEKLLQANMDMYFPVDVHDYHLVWQVIGPKENGGDTKEVNVQLWAFPIALLKRYYTVGNECGLSVVAVDYCGHSLSTAVGVSFARPEKKAAKGRKKKGSEQTSEAESGNRRAADTELHVLMEQELLGMTFVQNGQVVLQRCIRCGSQPSYQFGELAMMLEYFRSLEIGRGSTIRGIASGVYAADSYMIEELADTLGISFMRLPVDYDIRWVLCMGAARTDLEFGVPSMNAPGKTRTDIQGQLWQYAMILAGGLAVLAVVALILSSRLTWSSEIAAKQNEQNILMAQSAKYSGNYDNYMNYKSAYDSYSNDWDTLFGNLHFPNNNLSRVMEELENMMPEDTSVVNMNIGTSGLDITFACENKEQAAYLMRELRKLKYMDVNASLGFSYITGGGSGAAKTYGTQDAQDKVEAPPTQGSASIGEIALNTADNLVKALSKGGSMEKISFGDLELLNATYGQVPDLSKILSDKGIDSGAIDAAWSTVGTDTDAMFDERVDAMDKMFSENPFAVYQLIETLGGKKNELVDMGYHFEMLFIEPNYRKIMDFPDNLKGAREYKTKFNQVFYRVVDDDGEALVDSTKRLADTEKLLSGSSDLMKIYKYYLAMELNSSVEVERSYLDMAAIEADLSQYGRFNTQQAPLDKQLNKLIWQEPTEPKPDETVPTETEASIPTEETTEATESVIITTAKTMIQIYLFNGGTENEFVDGMLQEFVDTGKIETDSIKDIAKSLDIELKDSDIEKIKKAADNFIKSLGIDDIENATAIIEAAQEFLEKVKNILDKSATETTESTATPSVETEPSSSGADGEAEKPTEGQDKDVFVNDITDYLKKYIQSAILDSKTKYDGPANLKEALDLYFAKGPNDQYVIKIGDETVNYTKKIDDCIKLGQYNGVDKEIKEVFKNCYMHGFINVDKTHPLVLEIHEYLKGDGSCGNETLDDCFQRVLNMIHNDIFGDMLAGVGGGGNKGGAAEVVDTRIFFTAIMAYGEDMGKHELERKGLVVEDKIPEIVVNVEGDN